MISHPTYHFVSHSHWDREWYMTFEQFRVSLVEMIDDVFDVIERKEEFNSFLFDGQMCMVMDYLEIRPEKKKKFEELVQKEKLFIGPWFILADQFLPSGESHIRNLQIGLELANQFGKPMMIGYLPDQFGHIAQMPQILNGFNIDSAVVYRGFGGEPGQESSEYTWYSPDGSNVLMFHLPKDGYSFGYFAYDSEEEIIKRFNKIRLEIDARAQTSHRLILNGGDHFRHDLKIIEAIKLLQSRFDCTIKHTNLVQFVHAVKSEVHSIQLPRVDGELRFGLKYAFAVINGTASSRMYVKQENYHCQILLERILEPLNAITVLLRNQSRSALIKQAWKYLLQNQDHDVICGTSVDRVYDEVMVRYEKVKSIALQLTRSILNEIIPYHDSFYRDDKNLFLFNLLPYQRDDIYECDIEYFLHDVIIGINPDAKLSEPVPSTNGFRIIDANGNDIPFQLLHREEGYGIVYSHHAYPHQTWVEKFRILLTDKIPSIGYKKYSIVRKDLSPSFSSSLVVTDNILENEFVRVIIQHDGTLSILNKENGIEFKGLMYFEDSGDIGDEYTFCSPDFDEVIDSRTFKPEFKIIESGPLRGAIQISTTMLVPKSASDDRGEHSNEKVTLDLQTTISITMNSRRVDIKTQLFNQVNDHRLRVVFQTGMNTNISYADSQFAIVKREHKKYNWSEFKYEVPQNLEVMQRFISIQDDKRAMTLFTKGLPEYELMPDSSGTLSLTLLRCVGELSQSNLKTRPGGDAGWKNKTPDAQCHGNHIFDFSLYVHSPTDNFNDVLREAELYHTPVVSASRKHDVAIADEYSFMNLATDHVVWSCFKESEDGKGIVVRIYNPTQVEDKFELKFNFDSDKIFRAKLNESEIEELTCSNKLIQEIIDPFKIETMILHFKKSK